MRKFSRKLCFEKNVHPFRTFTEKYEALRRIFFRLGRQNCFLGVQRRVLKKKNFLIFWNLFRPLGIKCRPFVDEDLLDCQNYVLRLNRNNLMKNEFLKSIFYHIRHWTKELWFFSEIFKLSCKNCILLVNRKILKEFFFEKKLHPFLMKSDFFRKKNNFSNSALNKKMCLFVESFSNDSSKLNSGCHYENVGVICFFFGKRVHRFRTMSEKFSTLCRKKIDGVVKTAFYVSIGTFWWTNFPKTYFWSLLDIQR